MERLTYRSPYGNAVSKGACSSIKCDLDCDACPIDIIVQHLCYYEDMIESCKLVGQKHGHWIYDRTYIVCSECGAEYSDEIVFMNSDFKYSALHYCPNCGAEMNKEN